MPQDDMNIATARPARSPEVARVEAEIERARNRVTDAMIALRAEVVRRTDWRGWFRQRPVAYLAGALVLGFALGFRPGGAAFKPRTRRRWPWN